MLFKLNYLMSGFFFSGKKSDNASFLGPIKNAQNEK